MSSTEHFTMHARTGGAALRVGRFADALVDGCGYSATSAYVEQFWLPVLGPSSVWALRRLAALTTAHPNGEIIEVGEFAAMIGLGNGTGKSSTVARTLDRLVAFDVCQWFGDCLLVRSSLEQVPARHVDRFPTALRLRHERFIGSAARIVRTGELAEVGR